MSSLMSETMMRAWDELRHEPTERRLRATLGDATAVDTTRGMLVWEPRRVSPAFAVPEADLDAELLPAADAAPAARPPGVLHPGIPFAVHSTDGEELDVRAGGETRARAAFRPADPDLASYVVLDFDAFDAWYEEDERLLAHARDPYHRVDARRSSRHVRIELDGAVVAESARPTLVFETSLPVRFYLPREDVRVELRPTATRTACAYKGQASYWSFELNGRRYDDLAWTYAEPLPDQPALAGLVAFYDDRFDVTLDGRSRPRPEGVLAAAILEEFGVE
jgi:uncharacterized protein (DUF427 family)